MLLHLALCQMDPCECTYQPVLLFTFVLHKDVVQLKGCMRVFTEGEPPSSEAPDELGGSALRLLHQLANATSAAEALARTSPPAVPTLMAAMGWGMAGSALTLETLQRALTLANRARDSLVGSALGAGLVQVLLQRLDWRSASGADADNQVNTTPHPSGAGGRPLHHSCRESVVDGCLGTA